MPSQDATTQTKLGNGVKFSIAGTIYGNIVDIKPPKPVIDDIEVSHMESPDQAKEFRPGWVDGGEVNLTLQATSGNNGVYAQLGVSQPATNGFVITFLDNSRWTFGGYIKSFGHETERAGIVTIPLIVKISGKPVFTP